MRKRIAAAVLLIMILATSLFMFVGCKKTDYVIGVMENSEHFASDTLHKGFRETIDRLMNESGKSYKFVYVKSGGADDGEISASEKSNAQYLSKKGVDAVLTLSKSSYDSAVENLSDIPTVFAQSAIADRNLQKEDLRPQVAAQVELMRLLAPGKKLGVIYCKVADPDSLTKADVNMNLQIELAREYISADELVEIGYDKQEDKTHDYHIREALNSMKAQGVGCVFMPVDNTLASVSLAPKIHERANTNIYTKANNIDEREVANMPLVCGDMRMNEFCGVATYAVDYYAMGVKAAQTVYAMLTGTPSGIDAKRIEIKTDFAGGTYSVNQKVASDIGFEIPQAVLDMIDVAA